MSESLMDDLRELHAQGGVRAAGYPQGWCLHDHHPWLCPTIRLLEQVPA